MRRRLPLLALAALLTLSCHTPPDANAPAARPAALEITVSAAVSLKDAFTEIGRLYEARTGARVNLNCGASGVLQKQIEQGAPADVFASAGEQQMDALADKGLLLADTRHDFARNTLVLVAAPAAGSSRDQQARIDLNSFAQLAQPQVRKVAVGNPKTVPAGHYAEQLLTNLNLWAQVQPKIVFAEDVRQVFDYVKRGEVDAGIVYASDLKNETLRAAATAPAGTHDPILYPIAVVKDSPHPDAARQFVALVLSPEGQSVLTKYGFLGATP